MNKALLIGRLTADPELTNTKSGISVCRFTLAVPRAYKSEQDTDFINIVVWRTQAENCGKYLNKGSQCCVSGAIQVRSYEKDGQKRYITEIAAENVEFLTVKQTKVEELQPVEVDDEDLPF